MSKRNRHPDKQSQSIEWLNHRTGYPNPQEREALLHLRKMLSAEIIFLAVMRVPLEDPRYRELIKKYGKEEVEQARASFAKGMELSRVADDARSYRDYRLRYSRFGAGLKFYTLKEMDELYGQYGELIKESMHSEGAISMSGQQNEVEKVLLMDWHSWEDITPQAIPPRPADFTCPPPASYSAPVSDLLEYGPDLEKQYDPSDPKWKRAIPALTRMALDPGLLNGWPAENASWASWHAIHILGLLEAWESAPALAELVDLENDWLSDHLAHIWADMGRDAEPTLWMILENPSASEKQHGLAAEALSTLAEDDAAISKKVVTGFGKILQNTKSFDPAVNAYLIMFLKGMDNALDELEPIVDDAFEQGRVDLDIITPEDIWEDDDDEFDDDEFLEADDFFEENDDE